MDVAEGYIRDRGYNAFSYKDLANQVGIKTASIHYHYPTKSQLGVSVMQRYTDRLKAMLDAIDQDHASPASQLNEFFSVYGTTESCGGVCVCGSLASDLNTLSADLQQAVTDYIDLTRRWLTGVITAGIEAGEFEFAGKIADVVAISIAALQGALIISRTTKDRDSEVASVQQVMNSVLGMTV